MQHVLSKNCQYDQKHTLFSNFGRICTPKRCTRVHCLVTKTTLIKLIFLWGWYPTSDTSGPQGTPVCLFVGPYWNYVCTVSQALWVILTSQHLGVWPCCFLNLSFSEMSVDLSNKHEMECNEMFYLHKTTIGTAYKGALQKHNWDTYFLAYKIKTNYLMTKQVVWTFREILIFPTVWYQVCF